MKTEQVNPIGWWRRRRRYETGTRPLMVRITDAERAAWTERAEAEEYDTIQAWIIDKCKAALEAKPPAPAKPKPAVAYRPRKAAKR